MSRRFASVVYILRRTYKMADYLFEISSIMILCVLFLRVLALGKTLAKTKSWKRYVPKGWKSRGFTVQFSFSIAPYDVAQGRSRNAVARGENGEEGRLIET